METHKEILTENINKEIKIYTYGNVVYEGILMEFDKTKYLLKNCTIFERNNELKFKESIVLKSKINYIKIVK